MRDSLCPTLVFSKHSIGLETVVVLMPRLMSDYEVTLVNNKMSEFFVTFHGPVESTSDLSLITPLRSPQLVPTRSTIRKGDVEDTC